MAKVNALVDFLSRCFPSKNSIIRLVKACQENNYGLRNFYCNKLRLIHAGVSNVRFKAYQSVSDCNGFKWTFQSSVSNKRFKRTFQTQAGAIASWRKCKFVAIGGAGVEGCWLVDILAINSPPKKCPNGELSASEKMSKWRLDKVLESDKSCA